MEIRIDKLNINGEGISVVDGKKYCTKSVIDSEKVVVDVVSEKKNFCECVLREILEPSLDRVSPTCPYVGTCGGCDMMHISYPASLKMKKHIINEYFHSLYNDEIELIGAEQPLNYRGKVAFAVNGGRIGLKRENSNDVVEIKSCSVAKDEINSVLSIFRQFVSYVLSSKGKESKDYLDILSIHHVVVRVLDSQVMVTLVCNEGITHLDCLIELLESSFKGNFGLYININNVNAKEILGDRWHHIFGRKYLDVSVDGLQFAVYPHSFMQVNDEMRDKMYQYVADNIDGQYVVEGYSGAGILSAMLTRKAQHVTSVEINKDATRSANIAKEVNNISNWDNINGDFSLIFPSICDDCVLVVDPPRKGLSQSVLNTIKTSMPQKIIYISCSPYSLRQNIVYLGELYEIRHMRAFDLFPQTSKIECVAILSKK